MIQAIFPANHIPERRYAIEILLVEYLGLNVQTQAADTPFSLEIQLENGARLAFEDHFFNHCSENKGYLSAANIPTLVQKVTQSASPFIPEKELPILFGNDRLEISTQEIICGIDIVAATFFLLTRWEEYALPDRDQHSRFPAPATLAYKAGFLHRPIVNEMVEMLWAMLTHLGIGHKRKHKQFELLPTHDVDSALLWRNTDFFLKKLGGDLLKRLDVREAGFSIKSFSQTRIQGKKDPYDTFDYLMDCADRQGLQAHFYFLCGGETKFDRPLPLSHPFLEGLLKKIQERGHVIGLHPSYNSLHDRHLLEKEKQALEKAAGLPVRHGRQHFLRFEAPATWQMWEDLGMSQDSSLYYPEAPGFRCGTCHAFPVFDFLTRKKLRLRELPLTAMEVSWTTYQPSSPEKMLTEMKSLLETVRKYQGTFVLLWHNSSFGSPDWMPYQQVYGQLLEYAP